MNRIRNFAIIAHVDHGKSTLADRFLELTGLTQKGSHEEQLLDRNPISRERGITIKLAPVTMRHTPTGSSTEYILNLIDTPGHVDFSYEVERTLACVEGVILLVDATQGIQAQTIAHAYKALEQGLVIIPVINKVDREDARVEDTAAELMNFLGVNLEEIFKISAKTGEGVLPLLEAVLEKVPAPKVAAMRDSGSADTNACALIFDSYYDPHRGVIAFVRLFKGSINPGNTLALYASKASFDVVEVGFFNPELTPCSVLNNGDIGYVVTNLKDIHHVRVGDTMITPHAQTHALPGYRKAKPMIFTSVFPTDPAEYTNLKKALEKLYLNDAALVFEPVYSKAFGGGFRVGFLGLLHADVTRERLEREFDQSLILTPPKVEYRVHRDRIEEPYVSVTIITPTVYMGAVMQLCESSRAQFVDMNNIALHVQNQAHSQIIIKYEMPLHELISQFFDKLKTVTSGYASLDWELLGYRVVAADTLEVMLNSETVEEFSEIVVLPRAQERAREIVEKLKEVIPRQQFEVRIQAQYKGRIIASERVAPLRKDVTAKLYGGDRTRKDKLLQKQKQGKKLMKQIGKVEIPKEAFLKLFKLS